ncbi:MAG: hypothetical protein WA701_05585, partial [Solirubrobacterales bacterium]
MSIPANGSPGNCRFPCKAAVLLAFVVLEAFESFNDAKTGAEEEATTVLQLSRTADFFPPAERDPTEG